MTNITQAVNLSRRIAEGALPYLGYRLFELLVGLLVAVAGLSNVNLYAAEAGQVETGQVETEWPETEWPETEWPETEWKAPRTPDGRPDFQGFWTNETQTPIERPRDLGDKRAYTANEVAALVQAAEQSASDKAMPLDPDRAPPEIGGRIGQEPDINFSDTYTEVLRVKGEFRTSMIIDPSDGRFPFREGARSLDIHGQRLAMGFGPSDGPEIRTSGDRCLSRGIPPMVVPPYNSNFQIVQTANYLMLLGEMVHDARIIRLGENHHPWDFKSWLGDSVGWWEGDTLVVHTRNFRPEISHFRLISSDQLELTERFEIVAANEIYYSVTVTDPVIYTQPFTEELTLTRHGPDDFLYEYACHEGNYGLVGILAGARREEADALMSKPDSGEGDLE